MRPIIGSSTTINDNTMLASYQTAPVALPGGVQPCTCEYLSWGFWSSNINYGGGNSNSDRQHQSRHLRGRPADDPAADAADRVRDLQRLMVGNVQNGNNAYVGTGNYNMGWSYAARAGTFGATFDGTNYGGVMVAQPGSGGTNFGGLFAGSGGRIGALTGSFFGPQAQNQGGAFTIGTNASSLQGVRHLRRPEGRPLSAFAGGAPLQWRVIVFRTAELQLRS